MSPDSKETQTVWQLAHNWAGIAPGSDALGALPPELKEMIHRLLFAAINHKIPVRTKRPLFLNGSFPSYLRDAPHYWRFLQCLRQDQFDQPYLDSIHVQRNDVLRWCQDESIAPPPIWKIEPTSGFNQVDHDTGWYKKLTERQKKIAACLGIAQHIWKDNPALTYEQVYHHSDMERLDKPRALTLADFKRWARDFAPQPARKAGRRKESRE
ncbi:MAG: hypothetical protein V4443_05625 [Pseudomonadota bacterium]